MKILRPLVTIVSFTILSAFATINDGIYVTNLELPIHDTTNLIIHKAYTLSFNPQTLNPNWVAWVLTKERTEGVEKRSPKFYPDPMISDNALRVTASDYTSSGYDRGHQCPAADNSWDAEAMKESFYMTNMCPQTPTLNRGDWKKLEDNCRKWVQNDNKLCIVCGPLYNGSIVKHLTRNRQVAIPDGFYKVILSTDSAHPLAIGFIFGNDSTKAPLSHYAVSVDSIETITGLDFFSLLPDSLESVVESNESFSKWEKAMR